MALVYHHSSKKAARQYARTPNMEPNGGLRPNGGVTAMTVMNPGRPHRNPFQWIEGRGVRHRHLSPSYSSIRGASNWRKRSGDAHRAAKLYAVDERGTVLSRPLDVERLASNTGSREDMYNVEALRRAIRANSRGMQRNYGYDPEDEDEAIGEAMGSAYTETQRRAVKRLGSKPRKKPSTRKKTPTRKTSRKTSRKVSVRQGRDGSVTVAVRRRKKTSRKGTGRKSTARQRTTSRRATSRKTSRSAAKRTVRSVKRRASARKTSRKSSRKSSRRGSKKSSRKTSRKRTSKKRKGTKLAANRRRVHRTVRSIRRRASRRRTSRRRTSRR